MIISHVMTRDEIDQIVAYLKDVWGPDMMNADVIEVMAQALALSRFGLEWNRTVDRQREAVRNNAAAVLSALQSAGYRLAGPGECVVPEDALALAVATLETDGFESTAAQLRHAMLAARPQKEKAAETDSTA